MKQQKSRPSAEQYAAYDPSAVEDDLYRRWKGAGYFRAVPTPGRTPYCITIPPPNITGALHLGHALNNTIIDVMTRRHRMMGDCTLTLPGTDHAGIATQSVVERELAEQGLSRHDLGRERFVERCWQWQEKYGTRIYHQFEKLGCSYDWDRVRFTMDEPYVDAIMTAFGSWYERGLIYRGTRVVNWDVKLRSAVSDIEVFTEARPGKLYHFRYPFADGSGHVIIATTRPETMLGDTAVAAHPADARYIPLFGKAVLLPLANREIPFLADEYARPEFGTGAVKVTPAHDLDDFECGLRHNLPQVIVIGPDGKMTDAAPAEFAGLDRLDARERVVERMSELGLLEKIEDYEVQIPVSDRSGEIIEPLLSEQWFVDMKPLAEPAIQAVHAGLIRFVPERYTDIYLRWMSAIRPWCVSRQLWWGHRIPVWWTGSGAGARHAFARSREEAAAALRTEDVRQDEDVLDTWFSSALWPHATLGWPRRADELDYFYPTNLLSTAQEILYLWVARMIMSGLDFIHRPATSTPDRDGIVTDGARAVIPFRDVYIHATVLDRNGQRMSKSKGNGIDPLDLIDRFGADATRFALMQQAGLNQDIRFGLERTENARNFCNKLWNAARFVRLQMTEQTRVALPDSQQLADADRWLLDNLNGTIRAVNAAIERYEMDDATQALYQFVWDVFCDWYLELSKTRLTGQGPDAAIVRNVLAFSLEAVLRLAHPIMPFITEQIWLSLPHAGETIMLAPYPTGEVVTRDLGDTSGVAAIIEVVRSIRRLRAERNIAAGARLAVAVLPTTEVVRTTLAGNSDEIRQLARLSELAVVDSAPDLATGRWATARVTGAELFVDIDAGLDLPMEIARLDKELATLAAEIQRCRTKLDNPAFVQRARPEVVQQERERLAVWEEKRDAADQRRRQLTDTG